MLPHSFQFPAFVMAAGSGGRPNSREFKRILRRTTACAGDTTGGTEFDGSTPGNYLTGTASGLFGTVNGGEFEGLAVGTYDLQAD